MIRLDTVVTLGNFDGVHMGHRKLIETAKKYAEKLSKAVVLTFNPHPMFIFGDRENNALIMSPGEKDNDGKNGRRYIYRIPV